VVSRSLRRPSCRARRLSRVSQSPPTLLIGQSSFPRPIAIPDLQ
jgi:hypothetical protein